MRSERGAVEGLATLRAPGSVRFNDTVLGPQAAPTPRIPCAPGGNLRPQRDREPTLFRVPLLPAPFPPARLVSSFPSPWLHQ